MKKKKKGTTLKPLKKPCDNCDQFSTCMIEQEMDIGLNWRYGRALPAKAEECRPYHLWLSKIADRKQKYVSQDYVSQREKTFSPVASGEQGKVRRNLILDGVGPDRREGVPRIARPEAVGFHREHFDELASYFKEDKVDFQFLTNKENRCLYLFYFEGLRYREIAVKTNLKVRTVKHHISKARKEIVSFFSEKKDTL